MNQEMLIERLFQALTTGHREAARSIVSEARESGLSPEDLTHEVYWPVLENIHTLFRQDQLAMLAHHYAIRLLRTLVDQAQAEYTQNPRINRRILMFCGTSEADELTGQMVADLAEAAGYEIFFGGGGIANDEILAEIGEQKPDILLMFGSAPSDAPNIRMLIDTIRGVNACPDLQVAVGGGVFNRAEGLAEEIGADLWARDPRELLEQLENHPEKRANEEQRTVGRYRRTRSAA